MTTEDSPAKEVIDWFPVLITEFLVISIINAITTIAFARIRHLRKRSTYLIINLTVADLLVGTLAGPLYVYWKSKTHHGFTWSGFIIRAIELTFPLASQVNLSLISLERLHATLFPFRHCLLTKRVYVKIIIVSWFVTFLLGSLMVSLSLNESDGESYVWTLFSVLTLLVLIVSYIIIIVKVQRSPHSQHDGSIHTERKLSVTLLIVTGVSVLTILPWAIYSSTPVDLQQELSNASRVDIHDMLAVIYFANSMVNPLIYVIRMKEFRRALGNLVSRQTQAGQRQQRRAERKRATTML